MRGIGDNSRHFGEDEPPAPRPPSRAKITPEQEKQFAKLALRAAHILAAWSDVSRRRLVGKRQGDDAIIARRILFYYLRGRGLPLRLMARIFDLDRDQPGADVSAMESWAHGTDDREANESLGDALDRICDGLDALLGVKPRSVMRWCESELEADRAAARARRRVERAAALLSAPPPPPAKPSPPSTVDQIIAAGIARRAEEARMSEVRISMAVIRAGTAPGASREARQDAAKAAKRLNEIAKPGDIV
jgi:hypothetical protein